tara:strand:- start:763 stop:1224 length:462 start_codon:yes stop_codon:yes gene_type:complete
MTIPWWKIIGPETRTKIEWRKELNYFSIYSVSSLTFSFIGFLAFFYNKTNIFEASLLIIQGITSFQSDVTYLGIPNHWRTFDTLLASFFIPIALYRFLLTPWSLHKFIALSSFTFAFFSFHKSQTSSLFIQREFWHTYWHLFLQYASLFLYFS